jgi:hypothetical protein
MVPLAVYTISRVLTRMNTYPTILKSTEGCLWKLAAPKPRKHRFTSSFCTPLIYRQANLLRKFWRLRKREEVPRVALGAMSNYHVSAWQLRRGCLQGCRKAAGCQSPARGGCILGLQGGLRRVQALLTMSALGRPTWAGPDRCASVRDLKKLFIQHVCSLFSQRRPSDEG